MMAATAQAAASGRHPPGGRRPPRQVPGRPAGEEQEGRQDRDPGQREEVDAQRHFPAVALQGEACERHPHQHEGHPVIDAQAPAPQQAGHGQENDGPGERDAGVEHEPVYRRAARQPA